MVNKKNFEKSRKEITNHSHLNLDGLDAKSLKGGLRK